MEDGVCVVKSLFAAVWPYVCHHIVQLLFPFSKLAYKTAAITIESLAEKYANWGSFYFQIQHPFSQINVTRLLIFRFSVYLCKLTLISNYSQLRPDMIIIYDSSNRYRFQPRKFLLSKHHEFSFHPIIL